MLATLKLASEIVARLPEDRSCRGCDRYDEGGNCTIFRVVVPRDFVEQGCDGWIERIPF